jgi:hypothetical protein
LAKLFGDNGRVSFDLVSKLGDLLMSDTEVREEGGTVVGVGTEVMEGEVVGVLVCPEERATVERCKDGGAEVGADVDGLGIGAETIGAGREVVGTVTAGWGSRGLSVSLCKILGE